MLLYQNIFQADDNVFEGAIIDQAIRFVRMVEYKTYKDPIYLKAFINMLNETPRKLSTSEHHDLAKWCQAVLEGSYECVTSDEDLRYKFQLIFVLSRSINPISIIEDIVFCRIKGLSVNYRKSIELITPFSDRS